jgi:beta-glucosidase
VRASSPLDAIDGEATLWKAAPGGQWYLLDLGYTVPVSSVSVEWTMNCAKKYRVELSEDGHHYSIIGSETDLAVTGNRKWMRKPGEKIYTLDYAIPARYVRIRLNEPANPDVGYELIELMVNHEVPICFAPATHIEQFRDEQIPAADRADRLLAQMTFREKLHLAGGYDQFNISGFSRFGLNRVQMSDTTSGVKLREKCRALEYSTSFPCAMALSATWNPERSYEMGKAIAEECRANGSRILLAPGVNIYRSSTCGRNFEYFGEDPYLTARMAAAYIKGVQDLDVIATVKHFIANNNEFLRTQSNPVIDERALHEIYLPAFVAAINDADVKALMSSYNWFNGEKCGESPSLLTDILRGDLSYKWMVMSDWGGTSDLEAVPGSGQNLVMPGKRLLHSILRKRYAQNAEQAEQDLVAMIRPTVVTLFETGAWFGSVEGEDEFLETMPGHKETAHDVAAEAITLLKNDNILPLKASDGILVAGLEDAVMNAQSGSGSGEVAGYDHVNFLDGLRARFDQVAYEEMPSDETVRAAGTVIYFFDMGGGESQDRPFEVNENIVSEIQRLAGLNDRVVVIASSGTAFSTDWVDDVDALVLGYYLGQERGSAMAAVLSGEICPSGRLPFTFEMSFADSPAYENNVIDGVAVWDGHDSRFTNSCYNLPYSEGVFVGYRWYEGRNKAVRFPFGFGLSYAGIEMTKAVASPVSEDGSMDVRVTVKNTGSIAGAEVVQCYVHDEQSGVERPYRELKAWRKVFLQPGEERDVVLTLDRSAFAFWDINRHDWVVEPGEFSLFIGNSCLNVQQTVVVRAQ